MDMDYLSAVLKRWLLSSLVVMMMLTRGWGREVCEDCNCQISSTDEAKDFTQAIYSLKLVCNTGTIEWFGASGAVRLELRPFIRGDFRTCFVAESANIHLKISQENPHISSSKNYRLQQEEVRTLKMDHLVTSRSKSDEICVDSVRDANLLLYIEAVRTSETVGVPKIVFHYDVEKLDPAVIADPMEECRPCSKEEILDAYCSMDFVVVGSMTSVHDTSLSDKSDVTLQVHQIIHQREPHYFQRMRRHDRHLTGHVTVPRKCGVRHGDGKFLITGRERLGKLAMTCSPSMADWRLYQYEAECSHG